MLAVPAFMQINLPIEPISPASPPAPAAPSPSHNEAKQSFEHYLGSGEQTPAPKKPAAESASPAAKKPAVVEVKEPAKNDDKDVDPNAAAAVAAGAPSPPPPLPEVAPKELTAEPGLEPPLAPSAEAAPTPTVNTAAAAGALPPQPTAATPADPTPTAPSTAPGAEGSNASALVQPPEAKSKEQTENSSDAKSEGETEKAATEEPPPTITTALSLPRPKTGTPAAMDRRTMSNAPSSPAVKAKTAGISITDKAPAFAMAAKPVATVTQTAVRATNPTAQSTTATDSQNAVAFSPTIADNSQGTTATTQAETTTKAEHIAQDVNVTLDHVERLTENMKVTGSHQMELEVRLHDDSKVTISIQMERGELKTTFKTDSNELRDALANNWGQVSDKNGDRSIRLTPPVFESSDARNGFSGDSRQQPRDGRAFQQAETEGQRFTFTTPAKPAAAPAAQTSTSGLALYA